MFPPIDFVILYIKLSILLRNMIWNYFPNTAILSATLENHGPVPNMKSKADQGVWTDPTL